MKNRTLREDIKKMGVIKMKVGVLVLSLIFLVPVVYGTQITSFDIHARLEAANIAIPSGSFGINISTSNNCQDVFYRSVTPFTDGQAYMEVTTSLDYNRVYYICGNATDGSNVVHFGPLPRRFGQGQINSSSIDSTGSYAFNSITITTTATAADYLYANGTNIKDYFGGGVDTRCDVDGNCNNVYATSNITLRHALINNANRSTVFWNNITDNLNVPAFRFNLNFTDGINAPKAERKLAEFGFTNSSGFYPEFIMRSQTDFLPARVPRFGADKPFEVGLGLPTGTNPSIVFNLRPFAATEFRFGGSTIAMFLQSGLLFFGAANSYSLFSQQDNAGLDFRSGWRTGHSFDQPAIFFSNAHAGNALADAESLVGFSEYGSAGQDFDQWRLMISGGGSIQINQTNQYIEFGTNKSTEKRITDSGLQGLNFSSNINVAGNSTAQRFCYNSPCTAYSEYNGTHINLVG